MNNKQVLAVLLSIVTTTLLWSQQTINLNLLQGKWHSHKKAYIEKEYDATTISAVDTKSNSELHFIDSTTLKEINEANSEQIFTYTIQDDTLVYDYKEYKIVELTAIKLTLEQVGSSGEIKYYTKKANDGY